MLLVQLLAGGNIKSKTLLLNNTTAVTSH